MNKKLIVVMSSLGMTRKHARLYEELWRKGKSNPLQLSRTVKLNRSSIYRYLDDLTKAGLVEEVMGGSGKNVYQVAGADKLELVITQQEAKTERLRQVIPSLLTELQREKSSEISEVKYYRGAEGLRQMLWNVVASREEYIGLGYENWNTSVGKSFAEKLRQKNMETRVKSREISNQPDDSFGYTKLGTSYQRVYKHRAIDPKILEIKHDTYIYGDVFAYYYHYQGELFGVEIHNAEIARTQKQIFEILWKMAK